MEEGSVRPDRAFCSAVTVQTGQTVAVTGQTGQTVIPVSAVTMQTGQTVAITGQRV